MTIRLSELAQAIGLTPYFARDPIITSIEKPENCQEGSLTVCTIKDFNFKMQQCKAAVAIVPNDFQDIANMILIRTQNPMALYEKAVDKFNIYQAERKNIIKLLFDWPPTIKKDTEKEHSKNLINELPKFIKTQEDTNWRSGFGIQSGIRKLDRITNGFQPGELVVLASTHSKSKGLFCLSTAMHILSFETEKVGFVSLDMTEPFLIQAILSITGYTSFHGLCRGAVLISDRRKMIDSASALADSCFVLIESKECDIANILENIRRSWQKYHFKIIFIDHLQLIQLGLENAAFNKNAIIVKALKKLAVELNISIILTCQIKKLIALESEIDLDLISAVGIPHECVDLALYLHEDTEPCDGPLKTFHIYFLKHNRESAEPQTILQEKKSLRFENSEYDE